MKWGPRASLMTQIREGGRDGKEFPALALLPSSGQDSHELSWVLRNRE